MNNDQILISLHLFTKTEAQRRELRDRLQERFTSGIDDTADWTMKAALEKWYPELAITTNDEEAR